MDTSFLFQNCYTGTDFENLMVQFLGEHGFRAKKTGSNDGGIDIIATSITRPIKYSFNIQCKFFNKPLSKAPIQEVYAGTHYYNNGAAPVVITNNRVTAETRIFAKKLGVEIIADAEWTEIKQVIDSKKIANPNVHGGLMGILLAFITSDSGYLKMVSSAIHSKLSAFYPEQEERAPATKYLGLQLKLFWWLEANGTLSTQEKVDKLYDIMADKTNVTGADYASITNRELTLNTKGLFPNKV